MRDIYLLALRYLRKVWLHRRIALAVAFAAAFAGWIAVSQLRDEYQAETRVYVDTESMLSRVLEGVALNSTEVDEEFLRVARRTLLSRPNIERIARETDMDLQATSPEARERVLDALARDIRIRAESTGQRTPENLFTLSYNSSDPEQALAVVRSVHDVFVESVLGLTRRDNQKMERFLDDQIREYARRLEAAEERMARFKRENVGLLPGAGSNYFEDLQQARQSVEASELELRRAQQMRDDLRQQLQLAVEGQLGVGDDGAAGKAERESQIKELRRVLGELQLLYTEQHPDVVAARRRLQQALNGDVVAMDSSARQEVEQADNALDNLVVQELRVELGKAQALVASAQASVEEFKRREADLATKVDTIPAVEAELVRLDRDYGIYKRRYEELVQRRESAQMSREADLTTDEGIFQVIEPPRVGTLPVAPDRPQLVTLVLAAALALGGGLAFLLSQISPSFGDVVEMRETLGVPVLGRIGEVMAPGQLLWRRIGYLVYAGLLGVLLFAYALVMVFHALRLELF